MYVKMSIPLLYNKFNLNKKIASKFKLKTGCYDGVVQLSGVVQQFIANCVVGGRCMTNSNKRWHVKKPIADFYACS